jgi:hypothetical protein
VPIDAVKSRFMSLPKLALAVERDRREPDKIVGYAINLDHIAHELRDVLEWAEKREGDAYLRRIDALSLLRSICAPEPDEGGGNADR